MITRYALFGGKVREGEAEAFRAAVMETILPKWKQFPGALDVRVTFAEARGEGAPEFQMILAVNYPNIRIWQLSRLPLQAPCAPKHARRPSPCCHASSKGAFIIT